MSWVVKMHETHAGCVRHGMSERRRIGRDRDLPVRAL